MNNYFFEGRLKKTYGKDKLYFSENIDSNSFYWSNRFVNQIKRILVKGGVIDTYDYDLSKIHEIVDSKYINFNY